jgi:hypothetical protein
MATERNRQLVLVALVVVLGVVIYRMWPAGTSAAPAPASNRRGATAAAPASTPATPAGQPSRGATGVTGVASPDVHLESLEAEWPKPGGVERNLFRFRPKAPPPPPPAPPRPTQPVMPAQPVTPVPQGPPPLPPIALKFIGIIESPTSSRKIAVLSDGRNPPFQGEEGAIIEGRYRILKIGVESIEIAYADGRGRQTIRLTGS